MARIRYPADWTDAECHLADLLREQEHCPRHELGPLTKRIAEATMVVTAEFREHLEATA